MSRRAETPEEVSDSSGSEDGAPNHKKQRREGPKGPQRPPPGATAAGKKKKVATAGDEEPETPHVCSNWVTTWNGEHKNRLIHLDELHQKALSELLRHYPFIVAVGLAFFRAPCPDGVQPRLRLAVRTSL